MEFNYQAYIRVQDTLDALIAAGDEAVYQAHRKLYQLDKAASEVGDELFAAWSAAAKKAAEDAHG